MSFVTEDIRLLAKEVLKGDPDESLASMFVDCISESINNPKYKISLKYVQDCEDVLREVKKKLLLGKSRGYEPKPNPCLLKVWEADELLASIWNLERLAKSTLNRNGP